MVAFLRSKSVRATKRRTETGRWRRVRLLRHPASERAPCCVRQQVVQRHTEGAGQKNPLRIRHPARLPLDLGDHVAARVPPQPLARGSHSGLRQFALGAQLAQLGADEVAWRSGLQCAEYRTTSASLVQPKPNAPHEPAISPFSALLGRLIHDERDSPFRRLCISFATKARTTVPMRSTRFRACGVRV